MVLVYIVYEYAIQVDVSLNVTSFGISEYEIFPIV
jgi:hypothetical protein